MGAEAALGVDQRLGAMGVARQEHGLGVAEDVRQLQRQPLHLRHRALHPQLPVELGHVQVHLEDPPLRPERLDKIAKEKFGVNTKFGTSHGSSDGRFFAAKQIPVLLIKPKGGGHHGEGEWLDIKSFEKYHEVLREFTKKVSMR